MRRKGSKTREFLFSLIHLFLNYDISDKVVDCSHLLEHITEVLGSGSWNEKFFL